MEAKHENESNASLVVLDKRAASMEAIHDEPTSPGGLLLSAMRQGLPTEQLQLFLEHHQRAIDEQRRTRFAEALSAAQSEYLPVRRRSKSDRGKFAPMDEGVDAMREANGRHGLSFTHIVKSEVKDKTTAFVTVQCIVRHEGHEERGEPMQTVASEEKGMNLIRAIKSATTFLRRITMEAAFGLAPTDDDDGKDAQRKNEPERRTSPPTSMGNTRELSSRAVSCLAAFKRIGVVRDDLEGPGFTGKDAREWGAADIDALGALYTELSALGPTDRAARLVAMTQPEREPGQDDDEQVGPQG